MAANTSAAAFSGLADAKLPSVAEVIAAAAAGGSWCGAYAAPLPRPLQDSWTEAQAALAAAWATWAAVPQARRDAEAARRARGAELMGVSRGVAGSVLDVGSGPHSLLLQLPHGDGCAALDPLHFGAALEAPYAAAGVRRLLKRGEELCTDDGAWDEVWISNCLAAAEDPIAVLTAAMAVARVRVRVFEYTYASPRDGALHELTPEMLATPFFAEGWLPQQTMTGWMDDAAVAARDNFYCGVFVRPSSP